MAGGEGGIAGKPPRSQQGTRETQGVRVARLRMPAGMGIGPHPLVARAEADLERAEFEAAAEAFEPAASRLSAHDPARARAAQLAASWRGC